MSKDLQLILAFTAGAVIITGLLGALVLLCAQAPP